MKKLILTLMIVALLIPFGYAKENIGSNAQTFNKPLVDDYLQIDVNTVKAWVTNYGSIFRHPTTGNSGFEWPADGGVFAIYASGLWVGAKVSGEPRVAVAEYSYEFAPGRILGGTPEDPGGDDLIVYKLDKDEGQLAFPQAARDLGAPDSILGDQTLWCVYNDGDPSYHVNMATGPLKVQVQQTVFGFDRLGPLGNTVFIKWLVVNKSGQELTDTYISVWSDPDLGDSGDDFVGSDTLLSLGYVYNSNNNDGEYGASPPAAGYDFLQGPIVPSADDTALVSGHRFPGYKNLPMTSFIYYNNSNENNGNPQTGAEVYNFMQGRWRNGDQITFGGTGIDPNNPPTNYMYTGDPEAGTGWIDSSPADRRFMMTTGPFTLQAWEDNGMDGEAGTGDEGEGDEKPTIGEPGVQEIVVGVAVARGLDNRNSVSVLKFFDTFVQNTYDANFEIPEPPPTPELNYTELSEQIILDWDIETNRTEVEKYREFNKELQANPNIPQDEKYFEFEGYIVYQYDFLDRTNAKVIATFDVVNGLGNIIDLEFDPSTGQFIPILRVQADDAGLKRWLAINEDAFAAGADTRLINGTRYWFGLSAYGYNEHSVPKVIESSPNVIEVTPQGSSIGTKFHAEAGQMITSVKDGESDGGAFGLVVDPSKLTGHDYLTEFYLDPNDNILWKITDVDADPEDVILEDQSYQSTDSSDTSYPIADGIQWKVLGPIPGINTNIPGPFGDIDPYNGWDYQGDRWVSWTNWGGVSFGGAMDIGAHFFGSTGIGPADYVDVELRWAGDVQSVEPERWSEGAIYRRDQDYAHAGIGPIPFTAWDTENNRQLNVCFVEMDSMDSENPSGWKIPANGAWDMGWHEYPMQVIGTDTFAADTGFAADGGREYIFIMNSDYNGGVDYDDTNWGPAADVLYAIWPSARGSGADHPWLEGQWDMQVFASNVNAPGVTYTFDTPTAPEFNKNSLARQNVEDINVFPNPYYSIHRGERVPTEKWVTFTHLPPTCTIRIFTISGALVKTIEREGVNSTTMERWDLQNESELPVASGLYIYHIDVPGVGEKIGKVAIFMPEERLDTF